MVEPPCTIRPAFRLASAALAIPSYSSAPWCQKRRSSIATVARGSQRDIRHSGTGSRLRPVGTVASRESSAAQTNELRPNACGSVEVRSQPTMDPGERAIMTSAVAPESATRQAAALPRRSEHRGRDGAAVGV
jgi:hypothetical protein